MHVWYAFLGLQSHSQSSAGGEWELSGVDRWLLRRLTLDHDLLMTLRGQIAAFWSLLIAGSNSCYEKEKMHIEGQSNFSQKDLHRPWDAA